METAPSKEDAKHLVRRGGLAIAFVLLACGAFVAYLGYPLLMGTPVVLKTRPVDPFDPMRGQYMIINYDVGNLPAAEGISVGDTIYTELLVDETGVGSAGKVSKERPPEGLFLRGKVISLVGDTLRIEYGIEQFFFERGAEVPTQDITVRVKVASDGASRIVELLQKGEPVKIKYRTDSL